MKDKSDWYLNELLVRTDTHRYSMCDNLAENAEALLSFDLALVQLRNCHFQILIYGIHVTATVITDIIVQWL